MSVLKELINANNSLSQGKPTKVTSRASVRAGGNYNYTTLAEICSAIRKIIYDTTGVQNAVVSAYGRRIKDGCYGVVFTTRGISDSKLEMATKSIEKLLVNVANELSICFTSDLVIGEYQFTYIDKMIADVPRGDLYIGGITVSPRLFDTFNLR